jgi:N-succinyldiaminopimelate aminotransferase
MFERTVTISSAGKLFSATGWKVGWVYGPPHLIEGVARAHQFITFAVHHPTQETIAYALNLPDEYYTSFQQMYTAKRQLLLDALDSISMPYRVPEGTYFVLADYTPFFQGTSSEFARYLTREIGVACIPTEPFYSPEHAAIGQGYVRLAFCKSDETLIQVQQRFQKLLQL